MAKIIVQDLKQETPTCIYNKKSNTLLPTELIFSEEFPISCMCQTTMYRFLLEAIQRFISTKIDDKICGNPLETDE